MAIKSSQRLSSKVGYYIEGIILSIKQIAKLVYKDLSGEELADSSIKVNIFNSTEVDYNNAVNSAELVSNVLQSLTDIIDKARNTVESYGDMIDKDAFMTYIVDKVHTISPDCEDWINDDTIKDYLKSVASGDAEGEESGWGGSDEGFGGESGW